MSTSDVPEPVTPGVTWRPLREDDLPRWHALVQAVEAADRPAERYTEEDLRDELLAGSWKDPAHRSLAAEDDGGRLLAFGLVDVRPGDVSTVRASLWGGVHPEHRGRGLGRQLLAWQCAVGRQLIAAAPGSAPGELVLHSDAELADRTALARAAGFEVRRYHLVMRRRLTGDGAPPLPEVELPEGLRLVPWSPELDEQVRLAHNEAFADHRGSEPRTSEDWNRWVSGHRDARTDWSFVALVDRPEAAGGAGGGGGEPEVAGYTVAFAFEQDWVDGVKEGWTGLLGTRRAHRRRGVGAALLAASLRAFAEAGMDAAGLDVDRENPSGALGLYERLGYAPHHVEVVWGVAVPR
ncbi:GNAT family N-acetyltransferase [Streptomyces sp. NP160]|uniref:GNAT family N-acetyltransferase n=1 Tax=Streptomyces sp. NP160 TaxID=2586637 RepID=UPI001117FA37|nr:GNAT family N-acetyltransferase [Streptomyces sp. NP160]TNM68889.1 GNAT family N-acetyltransferase [Streptomyces sp. NP160]